VTSIQNPQSIDYPVRVVAFIDILGFSHLIGGIGEDPALHAKVKHALTWFNFMRESSLRPFTAQSTLEFAVFSDSVVIRLRFMSFVPLSGVAFIFKLNYWVSAFCYVVGLPRGGWSILAI